MAFSSGNSGPNAPMGDINVTPLVDVMLVLLIIFMVAAPLMTVGVPIDLPPNPAAQDAVGDAGVDAGPDPEGHWR